MAVWAASFLTVLLSRVGLQLPVIFPFYESLPALGPALLVGFIGDSFYFAISACQPARGAPRAVLLPAFA